MDAGDRGLAAYQVEITGDLARGRIVGLEGGVGPFAAAPFYDPAALEAGRIVIAAFTAEAGAPSGKVRVARIHMQESGPVEYAPRLAAAAAPGGARLGARIELVRAGGTK